MIESNNLTEEVDMVLSVENISIKFDNRYVLNNVSFKINSGEFVGLIGSNGAGKSVLLKVILGLLTPDKGSVNMFEKKNRKGNRLIGYVPQKIFLDSNIPLSGRDLVALGVDGHKFGIPLPSKEKKKRVEEILKAVDAEGFADSPVGKLSGGEQQRLFIAQALLTNPKLLLLDEPLSNLDIKSAYEVVQLISRIARERKVAVILVAHDMNPLLGIMNKVLYLAEGKAVMGKPDEIFKDDVLSNLYGYPVQVLHLNGRIMIVGGQGAVTAGFPLEDHCHPSEVRK
jgi:zinc/manganese transport system ATP-binding protein